MQIITGNRYIITLEDIFTSGVLNAWPPTEISPKRLQNYSGCTVFKIRKKVAIRNVGEIS